MDFRGNMGRGSALLLSWLDWKISCFESQSGNEEMLLSSFQSHLRSSKSLSQKSSDTWSRKFGIAYLDACQVSFANSRSSFNGGNGA